MHWNIPHPFRTGAVVLVSVFTLATLATEAPVPESHTPTHPIQLLPPESAPRSRTLTSHPRIPPPRRPGHRAASFAHS